MSLEIETVSVKGSRVLTKQSLPVCGIFEVLVARHPIFSEVLAPGKTNLITALARKNKRTCGSRKYHSRNTGQVKKND